MNEEMTKFWLDAFSCRKDVHLNRALVSAFLSGDTSEKDIPAQFGYASRRNVLSWFVDVLSQIPVSDIRDLMAYKKYGEQEIPQISSFSEVINAVLVLARSGGVLTYCQLGGSLGHVSGATRNAVAKIKYGENQGKMAAMMGLAERVSSHFKFSELGMVYFLLGSSDSAQALVARLLFRSVHFKNLMCIRIPECKAALESAYLALAASTRQRRIRTLRALWREYKARVSVTGLDKEAVEEWLSMEH